jgi:hypothetical protein
LVAVPAVAKPSSSSTLIPHRVQNLTSGLSLDPPIDRLI